MQGLTDRLRALGEDHPDTLDSRNNLAVAYESAGDLRRAIPLHEQNLTDRLRALGEHPSVASVYRALAAAEASEAPAGAEIITPRRPARADLTGVSALPGMSTGRRGR
ncbi:tetratricopeptide repeat protein [Streptomyces sp. NPDC055400]